MDCKISLELSDTDRNDLVCALEKIGFKKMPSHKEALFNAVQKLVNEAYVFGVKGHARVVRQDAELALAKFWDDSFEVVSGCSAGGRAAGVESPSQGRANVSDCPHCGARAFLGKNEDGGLEGYFVECRTCWCRTGTHAFDWEARQAWNKRV